MDYKYIEQLLERYFECSTTASEERVLRAFFSADDVPEKWASYKALFDTQQAEAQESVSEAFKLRVTEKAQLRHGVEAQRRKFSLRIALRPLYNAVAAIAIVMLVGHLAQVMFSQQGTEGTDINMAGTERLDSTVTTLENLKSVGNGQRTAAADDSLRITTPEPTTPSLKITK